MDSRWFMRIVSLFLALLLFTTVYIDDDVIKDSRESGTSEDLITLNVPLVAYYDTENLVVSGLPNTVDIAISGPKSLVQSIKARKDFNVFVDLENLTIGDHNVPVRWENISEKLEVKLDPTYLSVNVQEKITAEFFIEPEINESLLAAGYEIEELTVSPEKVSITGAKSEIDKITYVKATLDINDSIDETITKEARVLALDLELNKLDVTIEPEIVDVTINVINPSKEVSLSIVEKGSLPEGVEIDSIDIKPETIFAFGRKEVLDSLKELKVEVDVSEITEDTTFEIPVTLPEGLNQVEPEAVSVTVNVKEKDKRTFSQRPIESRGQEEGMEISFLSPEEGQLDVTVEAYQNILEELTEDDFNVFIDVSDLEVGEHEVTVKIDGLDGVTWNASIETVKVKIDKTAT